MQRMKNYILALLLYLETVPLSVLKGHPQLGDPEPDDALPTSDFIPPSLLVAGKDIPGETPHWLMTPFHEVAGHHTESQAHRCEPVTLSLCKGMYYQYTRMPNMFYHETQEEAGLEAHQFYPLVQINCSEDLRFLLCSMYTPICVKAYPHFLPPCRSICERVKAGCTPIMQMHEFPWPERMNCAQFPEYQNPEGVLCMERNLNGSYPPVESDDDNSLRGVVKQTALPTDVINTDVTGKMVSELLVSSRNNSKSRSEDSSSFDGMATTVLRQAALENTTLKRWLSTRLDVTFKCTCSCRPPLVKVMDAQSGGLPEVLQSPAMQHCAMPCQSYYFNDYPSAGFTNFWFASWAILCCLSALITVLTYLSDTSRFHYPELPIIFLAVCYLMISIAYIIRVTLGHEAVVCNTDPGLLKGRASEGRQLSVDSGLATSVSPDLPLSVLSKPLLTPHHYQGTRSTLPGVPVLHHTVIGRASCIAVFLLVYYFGTASSLWWLILMITWFLAAAMKWGTEAISKYSQMYHFIAWSAPTALTAIAFIMSAVEADPNSGMCTIGVDNRLVAIGFLFAPSFVCLVAGCFFLSAGFIALFRIRDVIKMQPSGKGKTEKLEKLMIRIGIFGLLYIIPNSVVLASLVYELHGAKTWLLGVACDCKYIATGETNSMIKKQGNVEDLPEWQATKPEYAVFLMKHFMNLAIGIASGFWVWSHKTLQRWKSVIHRGLGLKASRGKSGNMGLLPHQNLAIEQDVSNRAMRRIVPGYSCYPPPNGPPGNTVGAMANGHTSSQLFIPTAPNNNAGCFDQQDCSRSTTICSRSVEGTPMLPAQLPYTRTSVMPFEGEPASRLPAQHAQWSRQSSSGIGSCLSPMSSENKASWDSEQMHSHASVVLTSSETSHADKTRNVVGSRELDRKFLLSSADQLDTVGLPTPTNSDHGSPRDAFRRNNVWDLVNEGGSVMQNQLTSKYIVPVTDNPQIHIMNPNVVAQQNTNGTPVKHRNY